MSQQEIKTVLREKFPPSQSEKKGFLGKTQEALQQRGADLANIEERATLRVLPTGSQTEQPIGTTALQIAGTEIGALGDIVGEGVVSGLQALPEVVKEKASDIGSAILETDIGKAGIRALQQGMEAYGRYKEANPKDAATLESVVNIAAFATPIKGQSALKTTLNIPKTLKRGAEASTEIAPKALQATAEGAKLLSKGVGSLSQKAASRIANISPSAVEAFENAGVKQSFAAISELPAAKLFDRFLGRFPGASGIMKKNTDEILEQIEGNIKNISGDVAASQQEAGEVIQKGVQKFAGRFEKASGFLYGKLDKKMPKRSQIRADVSLSLLKNPQFVDDIFGKEARGVLQLLDKKSKTATGVRTGVTQGKVGTVAYEDFRKIRTLVGDKLSKTLLIGGEDEAALKRLYGSLSEDLKIAATKAGAIKEFEKANSFYSNYINDIEKHLQRVINKDSPEQVFKAALSGTKEGGTRISQIMRSLSRPERKIVRGTVLHRLGKATAGQQDSTGQLFSANRFLTNWSAVSPEAKRAMFGGDTATRKSLDNIAKVAERLKEVDRFGNPSGTAQQATLGALLVGGVIKPVEVAAGILGGNSAARLMTSDRFVKWLGRNANKKLNKDNLNKSLRELKNLSNNEQIINDDLAQYVTTLSLIGADK
jgi:hypothetical protein